ncbi:AGAP011992-PA-like protein [Anopheles sinensis]|uniref:Lipase n=1 Tax=Anopheles sinensis TaxID=74873 RepID=A0A084W4D5_ANOSI|nr:AGAP011992-PA-like protein [Anopheles sinensis]
MLKFSGAVSVLFTVLVASEARYRAVDYHGRKEITFNWIRDTHDVNRNQTAVLLQRDGYEPIRRQVRTDDGYLLTVYRIQPRKSPIGVILFHHGIRQSSDMWMFLGPKRSLAYQLYEAGYDVWFSNSRASPESDGHERLERDSDHYWDFSFHEIGTRDLPAMVDYILGETGAKSVHFVGYSEAGSAALVMLSELPDYNRKMASVELMAPPVFMNYGQFTWIARMLQPLRALFPWSVYYTRDALPTQICTLFRNECCMLFGQMADPGVGNATTSGPKPGCFNLEDVSLKQLEHYRQIIASGRFHQFDYGYSVNLHRYHRDPPPDYCLWDVTARVSLHYGNKDRTVDYRGVEQLSRKLPKSIEVQKTLYKGFEHRDFYRSPKTQTTVYPNIVKSIKRHTTTQ